MAQTNFTPISLYYSTTAAAVPTAGNLVAGELAINTQDGKLFYKDAAGVVQTIASKDVNSGTFTNISVSGVASFADGTVSLPSITNIGDTNTGIFFPAADTIAFSEGGVESMRVTDAGNLGLGTSSPTNYGAGYKSLAINGSTSGILEIQAGGTTQALLVCDASDLQIQANGNRPIRLFTNSAERMRITGTGDVGIGTSSPSARLHSAAPTQTDNTKAALFVSDSATITKGVAIAYDGAANYGYIQTVNKGIAYTNLALNWEGGNVGVGTASPSAKLHVVGGGTSAVLVAGGSGSTIKNTASAGSSWFVGTNVDSYILHNESNTPMLFTTNGSERMRIPSTGGLLVGTTSDNLSANGFRITSSTGQFGGITMTGGAGDGPQWQMINLTDAGSVPNGFRWLSFRIGSGSSEVGKIEKASSTSVAYTTTSDYRLKEEVEPLTNALDKVSQMRPVKWKWKNQNDGGEGFIAHELVEICPLAVTGKKDGMEKDGVTPRYQGVDTSYLVATLTAAIQEQQALIENLTTRLNALEGK
jgi:hypothetical protein